VPPAAGLVGPVHARREGGAGGAEEEEAAREGDVDLAVGWPGKRIPELE
jgi:hypothetical protein